MKSIAYRLFSITLLMAASTSLAALAAGLPRTDEHDYDAPLPGTYSLPIVKQAADGEVLDANNTPLRLRELIRGHITLLSFIYTRCASPRACPYATGVLMHLHRLSKEDAALAREMGLVSLSFDPRSDTPERMKSYSALAGDPGQGAQWRFLTTASAEKLRPILEGYGQAVDKKKNPLDPTGPLNHTLRVFLIDREGRIRNIYSSGTLDLRLVLADVKTLLMESEKSATKPITSPQGARQSAANSVAGAILFLMPRTISWWIWLVTAVLLSLGVAGFQSAFLAAIVLSTVQAGYFWIKDRSLTFPVQIRLAYTALLVVCSAPHMHWLYWLPTVGTSALIVFGYCLMARVLSLMPWNRTVSLNWSLVHRTFLSPPAIGNLAHGLPAGACANGVCELERHVAMQQCTALRRMRRFDHAPTQRF